MKETIVIAIAISILALVFVYLGFLIWKKEKITLLHSYHYDKVSPSDKKVFCKMLGCGVIFVGIGLLATAIIIGITDFSACGFGGQKLVVVPQKEMIISILSDMDRPHPENKGIIDMALQI